MSKDHLFAYLRQAFSGALFADDLGGRKPNGGFRGDFRKLHPYMSRHWRVGVLGGSFILGTSLLTFPQPLIHRYLIDEVIMGRRLNGLLWVLLLMASLAGAKKLSGLLQSFYLTRFEQKVLLDIQQALLERVLRFPKSFFDAHQTGYLHSRLSSDVHGLSMLFSSTLMAIGENLLRFAGGIVLLFYLEWRLAIGVLILLPGIFWSMRYFSRRLHLLSHRSMEQNARLCGHFQEVLSAVPLIKAFAAEIRTVGRLMSDLKAAFRFDLEESTLNSVANLGVASLPALSGFAVLAIGAYWTIQGQWTLGSLFAFQGYLGYVFGPVQFLASANLQFQNVRASLERVSALFEILPEENLGRGREVERLRGGIEFRKVSFSYDLRETVLQDVSFMVQPGEHLAIVGPSGVGKTTLVSLILRFYRPTAGEIYFDGLPAPEYEIGSLRRRIGYVPQDTILLSGTILENLRYGDPTASRERVLQAAKGADIHDFIISLPQGYESLVGERGVNLSTGQKQRLSIARALVKDPDILVLDEPTSALDSMTEQSIFQSLPTAAQGKTLFIVAHRLSTIKDCNRILLLERSHLLEFGTHRFLLENNRYYRAVAFHQQGDPPVLRPA